ncbi:hypothetical protein V1504DRAFT_335377 [Lipomyces starkeyi]
MPATRHRVADPAEGLRSIQMHIKYMIAVLDWQIFLAIVRYAVVRYIRSLACHNRIFVVSFAPGGLATQICLLRRHKWHIILHSISHPRTPLKLAH